MKIHGISRTPKLGEIGGESRLSDLFLCPIDHKIVKRIHGISRTPKLGEIGGESRLSDLFLCPIDHKIVKRMCFDNN